MIRKRVEDQSHKIDKLPCIGKIMSTELRCMFRVAEYSQGCMSRVAGGDNRPKCLKR